MNAGERGAITTVTLNAAIDRRLEVSVLTPRTVMRARRAESTAGGKGLNVARVARRLGCDVIATGFIAGHAGSFIAENVEQEGIAPAFVRISGESRSCINIIDASGHSTEILEPGPTVDSGDLETLLAVVRDQASRSSIVAMSGSLPWGCPEGFYADLIREIHAAGALAFLDSSSACLSHGLQARPDFVKPNTDEIRDLVGEEVSCPSSAARAAIEVAKKHQVRMVVVSLGPQGAVGAFGGRAWWVEAPDVPVANTVGCGDAFVGAFAVEHQSSGDPVAALVAGVRVSSAVAMSDTTGSFRHEDLDLIRQASPAIHEVG
jgi:1-phosphofructokinase family hexose kinase